METEMRGMLEEGGLVVEVEGGRVGRRSPRMQTSAQMTVRPPRMMCCVPCSWERRETLLPVSVVTKVGLGGFEAVAELVGLVVEGGMVSGGVGRWVGLWGARCEAGNGGGGLRL